MRVLFAPYSFASQGCKNLATGIGALRTKATKRFKRDTIICNWGRSDLRLRGNPNRVLNPSHRVLAATNKLSCLNLLKYKGVGCVEHTTDINMVKQWLETAGTVVYGRRLLNASQGKGIVIISKPEEITYCPLYTKGILRAHEYRVHVFGDKIIDITKKRRRNNVERHDYIKNLSNGWVYCRDNIVIPNSLLPIAKDAVAALNLDFGAVDILVSKDKPYVLEINTAPGLTGITLKRYIYHFNSLNK